jgi:SAM-dependent methyltransferase
MATNDAVFTGSIPALYDRHLGPMLFQPYAEDLAGRLADMTAGAVLETAAGTGIATQALATALPEAVAIVATDLSQAMLDHAATKPGMARVTWQQADALALPFPDAAFEVVVCQFAAMFFPDRPAGYREARRVLKPGGRFLFSVWGSLADNPIAATVNETLQRRYPQDPPDFFARTPYGYHDPDRVRADVQAAGFATVTIDSVILPSRAASARDAAIGPCQGTPLRGEITARDPDGLEAATVAVADAVAARFGPGPIEAPMRAYVVTASG